MKLRRWLTVVVLGLGLIGLLAAQRRRGFREMMEFEDNPAPFPVDGHDKTELYFARLMYPMFRWGYYRGGSWATDYPKADRQFLQGVRRLTRINVRSAEEVVDLESDKIFDYPFVYAVEVGRWDFSESQARKLREYLLKGGFLMTDDFHGTVQWEIFAHGLNKVFPDKTVVDIENKDAIFHVLYDLDERFQVPGIVMFNTGRTYEDDGIEARWRAVYDDKGKILMAICHNMDLGDAWEWADWPRYDEKYASLAYRVGVNYIIYAMTH
jgi:hypothetical protein